MKPILLLILHIITIDEMSSPAYIGFNYWSGLGVDLVIVIFLALLIARYVQFYRRHGYVPASFTTEYLLDYPGSIIHRGEYERDSYGVRRGAGSTV
jgi:hypothetical protein